MNRRAGRTWNWLIVAAAVALAVTATAVVVFQAERTRRVGPSPDGRFRYDLQALRKTNPDLVLYVETAAFETGFKRARAIAVGPDDKIYVAGDRGIRTYAPDGRPLTEIALTGAPRALAAGADGRLYVCMKDHVEVVDPTGRPLASWAGRGPKALLTSIAVAGGQVFVADAGNRIVLRYDAAGRLLGEIGKKDPRRNVPGFVIPSPYFDIALGADGLLRVADPGRHRIEAYTPEGDLEFFWGRYGTDVAGFSGCCNPVNFAMLPGGGFVTCEKGISRVKTYTAAGAFEGVVAGAETFSAPGAGIRAGGAGAGSGSLDVAVDSTGRVLVLEPHSARVRIFTRRKPATRKATG